MTLYEQLHFLNCFLADSNYVDRWIPSQREGNVESISFLHDVIMRKTNRHIDKQTPLAITQCSAEVYELVKRT